MRNLEGFDAYNWLAFLNAPVDIDTLAEVAACNWNLPATKDAALNHGCIGITLACLFETNFATSYHAIADVFKQKYGEGFWLKGFSSEASSTSRLDFYRKVREELPAVIAILRAKQARLSPENKQV